MLFIRSRAGRNKKISMALFLRYYYPMRVVFLLILSVCTMLSAPAFADGNNVVLTSLEWPPYTGEHLDRNGATAEVVRAAFQAVGYDVEIRYLPWNRAMQEARLNPEVVGYFPEYPNGEREQLFLFSHSVGKSPLGFAMRKSQRIQWKNLRDLGGFVIGTVDGYVNSEVFDRMVRSGELRTDSSVSDVFNLRKVLAGRVDLGVADINVYAYLLMTDPFLRTRHNELRMDYQLLAIHDLFVCFRKGPEGERLVHLFNEGLSRINVQRIQREYIEEILEER